MQCSGKFRLDREVHAVNSGRAITTLKAGCIVMIGGESPIPPMIQVLCEGDTYSMFAQDLLERGVPVKEVDSESFESEASFGS